MTNGIRASTSRKCEKLSTTWSKVARHTLMWWGHLLNL